MSQLTQVAPLTEAEIRTLAHDWFTGLNEHWPLVRMLPMLAADDLRMVFPEATLTSLVEFEQWYQGIIRTFFDQDHNVRELVPDVHDNQADVKVTVVWTASRWEPPAATSTRSIMRADQTWTVKRSAQTDKPVIAVYTVHGLTPVRA